MFSHVPSKKFVSADAWLQGWYEALEADQDTVVYSDDTVSLTKTQVEDISGRIYGYLKQNHVGKEDFVLICLPRGAHVFAAMLGVLKAASAYVVVEAGYPQKRIEYVQNDVGCKLVLDSTLLDHILQPENNYYLQGFEHADAHDAAYAVYTSGTTGTPKGIIHERGSMHASHISAFMEGDSIPDDVEHFAVLAPLNFSATMLIYNAIGNMAGELYIPSYETIKNPKKLIDALVAHSIGTTFMAPSMLESLAAYLPDTLTRVVTGSACADNVYGGDNRSSWNYYMASETCFVISMYKIDAPTKPCPVGKPNAGIDAWIADDGQVVVRTPYCRGYINDTSKDSPFKDGCYYTGDIASTDSDGNFILSGRLSDMIKIDGNRVDPSELEAAFSQLTNLRCVAKGFEERQNSFMALYYVPDTANPLDTNTIVKSLYETLPYYMVPSYFVPVEKIPKTALGKIDRKQLSKPKAEHKPYIVPRTDLEKALCHATEHVLHLNKVGLADDFFELGGRSMDAIEILAELNIEGLSADMFYRGRTMQGIAQAYEDFLAENNNKIMTEEEKELEGRKRLWPIEDSAGWLAGYQLAMPDATDLLNLYSTFKLTKLVNMEKLRDAINTYTRASSTFNTIVAFDENQLPCYKYAPELYKPVEIETMSEAEVEELRLSFVKPFRILEELPWRIRLIQTKKANYLFWDIHHILTDGAGISLFAQDIFNIYLEKPTKPNDLYAFMYDREILKTTSHFAQIKAYQHRVFDNDTWGSSGIDFPTDEVGFQKSERSTGIKLKELNSFMEKNKLSRADLFLATVALALGKIDGKPFARSAMMFANRMGSSNTAGVRTTTMHVLLPFEGINTIDKLLSAASQELQRAISMSCYNYELHIDKKLTFPCIDDLEDMENIPPLLEKFVKHLDEPDTTTGGNTEPVDMCMLINFLNKDGYLYIRLTRDIFYCSKEKREEFMNLCIDAMKRIMAGDETVIQEYLPA